jgi:uncharacterized protein
MRTPWGDLTVRDAHVHFFSRPFFQSLVGDESKLPETAAKLGWILPGVDPDGLAETWTVELNRHGVASAAIIGSVPGDEKSVLAAQSTYPDRFRAYAMVNPLAANVEVAYGLHAICLFPAMHRYSLHDPKVESLIQQAEQARAAVFVHCGVLTVGVRRKLGLPSPFDMRFSNPLDLHAVALRHPKTPFLVPHFGAGYLREALMLADLCPNVYLDTSSSNSWMRYEGLDLKTVFRRALDVAGPKRLLFGSDSSFFPRGWNAEIFETQSKALYEMGVSAADAKLIFGENLQQVFS